MDAWLTPTGGELLPLNAVVPFFFHITYLGREPAQAQVKLLQ